MFYFIGQADGSGSMYYGFDLYLNGSLSKVRGI